jgi:hypothetical protein
MIRATFILGVSLLVAGCSSSSTYNSGIEGPTGRASDAGKISSVSVHDTWKMKLKPETLDVVRKKLQYADTARFDGNPNFEGFYNASDDVTRIGAWGNVTSSSPWGTVYKQGYYVTWELPGKVTSDFPPLWHLGSVELFDQQF